MSLPPDTHDDLWVSWDQYHRMIEDLCLSVHRSGWPFDQILCLARGGLRVGDVASRVFDKPLAVLATSSYRADAGTVRGELDIGCHITISRGSLGGHVLLVDDLVDSGVTLARVREHLLQNVPAITEIRSAVLWWKAGSQHAPDYWVDRLSGNPWIHQPFEEYDALTIEALARQRAG
jgi:hypoxanthine phosphoribosyltransferase